MKQIYIENQTFPQERALYAARNTTLRSCRFEGEEDGESALKECRGITAQDCYFALRYPFWHVTGALIERSEMTVDCRAALWYCKNIAIMGSKLHGIKALRECSRISMEDCSIISPEFGWSTDRLSMKNCDAESEYFLMRASRLSLDNVHLKGKYSFQYVNGAVIRNCHFDTKDAFWHSRNITVYDSVLKGEYLGWYSQNLTLVNCTIIGTQPLCYCKGLRLVNCRMESTDLSFELSQVHATIEGNVDSIKNPLSGTVRLSGTCEIIRDNKRSHGRIITEVGK